MRVVEPLKLFHDVLPNAEGDVYTVPDDTLVVVRQLVVVNITVGAASALVKVAGKQIIPTEQVDAKHRLPIDVAIPMAEGETIRGMTTVAGALQLLVTGFSYTV